MLCICFFHPSPCNEVIEISNWNVPWSYQDRSVINFKVFLLFICTVPRVILCPGLFNLLFLGFLSLISALSNVSILAFHLCFPPIKPTTRPTNHGLWGVIYLLYFSFIIYKIKILPIFYVFYKYSMA